MTAEDQLVPLFQRTLEKSRQRVLDWKPDLLSNGFAVALTPFLTLRIFEGSKKIGGYEFSHHFLQLKNADGDVLGTIGDDSSQIERAWGEELFELARRKALNVDESVSDAMRAIDSL